MTKDDKKTTSSETNSASQSPTVASGSHHLTSEEPDPLDLLGPGDLVPEPEASAGKKPRIPNAEEMDYDRRDRAFTNVQFGQPRTAVLSKGTLSVMRLTDADLLKMAGELLAEKSSDALVKSKLLESLDQPLTLGGPNSFDAVDDAIGAAYEECSQFGAALQEIRRSAQLNLARGASWFSFRPTLIVSPPGTGKTGFASKLASKLGLPCALLDGSTMTTSTPLLGGDAIYKLSRASDIIRNISAHGVGNPIVVFDEVDKATDTSRGGRENPAEALLGFLEPTSARRMHDHYLGIDLDLSHLNWILLANDIGKLPGPLLDRCKVIRMSALTPQEITEIAAREIERRQLEPDVLRVIARACARREIKSLRKLHKILDAAQAALSGPRLH